MPLTDLQTQNISQAPEAQRGSLSALYASENSPSQGSNQPATTYSATPTSEPSVISTNTGKDALNTAIQNHQTTISNIQTQNTPASNPTGTSAPTNSDATITAVKAQGGITADEANIAGITTDMLTSNYNYDTNTGYYIPKDSTAGATDASNAYTADQKKITDSFTNITGGWDTATQNLIDSLTKMYNDRIDQQKIVNSNEEAAVNTEDIRSGTSRYAGDVSRGILTSEENVGLDRIKAIQDEMNQAITTAQMNLQNNKYKAFMDQQGELDSLKTEQNGILKDLHDQAIAKAKQQQDEQDKVTSDINSVASDAAKNGAPASVQKAIAASKTQADAITAAGDYLQTGTGQVQDYLMYKRDASVNGQTPEDYSTWKAADDARQSKEKTNEAYATAFASASGKADAEARAANTANSTLVPVTGDNGITYNVPAGVGQYVKISPSGVKYVDVSGLTPSEKGKIQTLAFNGGVNPIPVITDAGNSLDVQNIADATLKLKDMKTAFDAASSGNAAQRDLYAAAAITMAKKLQTDPAAVGTDIYQDTALDILKAMSGTKGFRGGASMVEAVQNTFPKNTDTQAVVDTKIANIQKLIDDRQVALIGHPSASDQLLIDASNAQGSLTDYATAHPEEAAKISQALKVPGATPASVYKAMKDRGIIQ